MAKYTKAALEAMSKTTLLSILHTYNPFAGYKASPMAGPAAPRWKKLPKATLVESVLRWQS